MPASGPPTKKRAKKKAKKNTLRAKLRRNWKKFLIVAVVIGIAAIVITDEDPKPCPILDTVQEEIDHDQGFHQRTEDILTGGATSTTCWFQTLHGANDLHVNVEVITYNHPGGAEAEFQTKFGDPSIEHDSQWDVKIIPVSQTGELQQMKYTHTRGNRLCVATLKRPFNGETPEDLETLREGAKQVATTACTPDA